MNHHQPDPKPVFEEGLTDKQIANLDAIEKASVLRQLVADAVETFQGQPELSEEEIRLLMDYRAWRSSAKSVGGIFHWRRRE
jgi:hypothetical protein